MPYLVTVLKTKNLTYQYAGAAPLQFPDLSVAAGTSCLLLGPSGSGKSTWLHLLGGVLTPTAGTASLGDTPYSELRGGALDRFRGRNIGIVFQRAYFLEALSVEENLAIARHTAGLPPDKDLLARTLAAMSIEKYARRAPRRLSVGEQQRVTIARALVNQPRLLLADEPTSALDGKNAATVSKLLCDRARELGAALVVVTHDERIRADYDQIIELKN